VDDFETEKKEQKGPSGFLSKWKLISFFYFE
jgi:hypothetical protein